MSKTSSREIDITSNNQETVRVKVAIISFHGIKRSWMLGALIFFIEHTQLLSQSLLLRPTIYESHKLSESSILRGFIYAAKLLNPSCLLKYEDNNEIIYSILGIVVFWTFLKVMLFVFIFLKAKYNKTCLTLTIKVWRWIFKSQTRVLYYFTASFWVNTALSVLEDRFDIGISKDAILGICIFLILLEFGFSIFLRICFNYVLPSKDLLSSKDNHIEIMTLFQKFIISILQILIPLSVSSRDWILIITNLCFHFMRNARFSISLPLYHLEALFYQGYLLLLVTSLDLSSFLQLTISSLGDEEGDIKFLIVCWILMSIFAIIISKNLISKLLLSLATTNKLNPRLLIQKVNVIKYFRNKAKILVEGKGRLEWSNLLFQSIKAKIRTTPDLNQVTPSNDPNSYSSTEFFHKTYSHYFENALIGFPNNKFIKLYIAFFYAKKLKLYGKAIKLLTELQQSNEMNTTLNAALVINDIQKFVKAQYENNTQRIDLSTYIQSQKYTSHLKKLMLGQADLQIKLLQEMTGDKPDQSKMFKYGKIVDDYRQNINAKIKSTFEVIPDYFIQPLMICANYYSTLNHSYLEYQKYLSLNHRKYEKYSEFFQKDNLIQENFYQQNNVFLLISAQKTDAGKIFYCSDSIRDLLGNNARFYLGTNISSLFLPKSETFQDKFFKEIIEGVERRNKAYPNNLSKGYINHKEGYMIEVNYFINLYPIFNQGFYLGLVLRKAISQNCLIVNETGDIEGATHQLSQKLNLNIHSSHSPLINIKDLSSKLSSVINAINMINTFNKVKQDNLENKEIFPPLINEFEQMKELYTAFTTEGKVVSLNSINPNEKKFSQQGYHNSSYDFHCKIKTLEYGSRSRTLITLDEIQYNDEYEKEINFDTIFNLIPPEYDITTRMQKREGELKSSSSEDFTPEEEKREGWIDFNALQSDKREKAALNTDNQAILSVRDTEKCSTFFDTICSPLSQKRLIEFPLSPTNKKSTKISQFKKSNYESKTLEYSTPKHVKPLVVKQKEVDGSVATSKLSKLSNQRKVSKAFKVALTTNYYSRSFKIIFFVFYLLMLGLLIIRSYFKLTLDDMTEVLNVKKNILISAQLRTYSLSNVLTVFRQFQDLTSGRLSQDEFGLVVRSVENYETLANYYMTLLSESNKDILRNANLLDEETKKILFYKDVRMFDTINVDLNGNNFIYMTSFQGTERIIETSLKLLEIKKANNSQGFEQFSYLLRNCLNDLYLKNNEISDILFKSGQGQIDSFRQLITIYIILGFGIIGGSTGLINFFIWREYFKEKKNMTMLMKVNGSKIKTLLIKVSNFKRILQEEGSFERSQNPEYLDSVKTTQQDLKDKRKIDKNNFKSVDFSGTQRKYLSYTGKGILFILLLIGMVVWSLILCWECIDQFHQNIFQLNFTYGMSSRINLSVIFADEIVINGATLVENKPTDIGIIDAVEDIQLLKTEVLDILARGDIIENPLIKQILFDDGCQLINGDYALFCQILSIKGVGKNIVGLLNTFENCLDGTYQDYTNSNKSDESLRMIELKYYEVMLAVRRVLTAETILLGTIVDQEFQDYEKSARSEREAIFIIFVIAWAVLIVLIWFSIIGKLKETNNDFKKLLQAFPVEVVLSSFLLKNYLLKTSKGALDSVKNII